MQVCEALQANPVDISGMCCAVQLCEALQADPVDIAGMSGALR